MDENKLIGKQVCLLHLLKASREMKTQFVLWKITTLRRKRSTSRFYN